MKIDLLFVYLDYAKVTIQKSNDEKEATVTFTPDLEEQKRLMQVYAASIFGFILLHH